MSLVDEREANRWLTEHYGTTIDGQPLFRVVWNDNRVTEKRKGTFRDYVLGTDVLIREVTEVRECLKYPFAQDRWILEKITILPDEIYGIEIFSNNRYAYEGIYIFQTAQELFLPLNMEMLQTAMYLALVWGNMKYPERLERRFKALAEKEKAKKEEVRQLIGQNMRSHIGFVLDALPEWLKKKGRKRWV